MSIFFRHILKEVAVSCCVSVVLFAGILISGNAIRDIFEWFASGRLTIFESIKIMAIIIPSVVSYALPLGILSGILISMGKLSSSNEILTMKSIGISIYKISIPILILSILSTIVSCFINLYFAPDSVNEYRDSFKQILQRNPIRFIRANEFIDWFPGYVIYVDSMEGEQLSGFKIWQLSPKNADKVDTYINADHGKITYDDKSGDILLSLSKGNIEHFKQKDKNHKEELSKTVFFKELSLSLPITGILGQKIYRNKKLKHMNIRELMYARKHWRSNASLIPSAERLKHDRMIVDMHISNNIAMSFSTLAMTLIAIPLGIRLKRADTSINVLLALLLAFGYYFSMVILSWFSDSTKLHPEILIWLPNLTLTICGISLLEKIAKN